MTRARVLLAPALVGCGAPPTLALCGEQQHGAVASTNLAEICASDGGPGSAYSRAHRVVKRTPLPGLQHRPHRALVPRRRGQRKPTFTYKPWPRLPRRMRSSGSPVATSVAARRRWQRRRDGSSATGAQPVPGRSGDDNPSEATDVVTRHPAVRSPSTDRALLR